ncbi:UNVERIFIED_CONTAM: Receptor-like protein EIX2 [Sesamum calycinum]|uniref:Receptor-like protein EIX2 n=1 Tax=Sesamum calycinum TaxID=2727403 RepID=A0AAW2P5S7_9LAMI
MFDVGGNQLTGNIPAWLGTNLMSLRVLSLRDNEFSGTVPLELCDLTEIQVLDLSGNNISGRIPGYGSHFDVSFYIENALVHWKGLEREYNRTLRLLKLIDLSNNGFVGNIPKEFSLLRGLVSLNLSRNHLTGNIDSEIGQMEMLESLDLSRNQLCIPSGTQLRGFNASAYAGNNGLCGPPLAACLAPDHGPGTPQATDDAHVGKEDSIFGMGFYISVVLGFVVGFWGVIVILVVNKSWRIAYFGFWNKIYDWLYVTITIIYLRRSS